jgi:hypothetical protein
MNCSVLHQDNAKQSNRQYGPDDDKGPDLGFPAGNSKNVRPIDQHTYTPIKDLIYHFLLSTKSILDRNSWINDVE